MCSVSTFLLPFKDVNHTIVHFSWDSILSPGVPGVTAADTPDSFGRSDDQAVPPDRLDAVFATRRRKAANRRKKRADCLLVNPDQNDCKFTWQA